MYPLDAKKNYPNCFQLFTVRCFFYLCYYMCQVHLLQRRSQWIHHKPNLLVHTLLFHPVSGRGTHQ